MSVLTHRNIWVFCIQSIAAIVTAAQQQNWEDGDLSSSGLLQLQYEYRFSATSSQQEFKENANNISKQHRFKVEQNSEANISSLIVAMSMLSELVTEFNKGKGKKVVSKYLEELFLSHICWGESLSLNLL